MNRASWAEKVGSSTCRPPTRVMAYTAKTSTWGQQQQHKAGDAEDRSAAFKSKATLKTALLPSKAKTHQVEERRGVQPDVLAIQPHLCKCHTDCQKPQVRLVSQAFHRIVPSR